MNSEKANGMMEKVAGKAQEIAGDVTGNERLQAEGAARQAAGVLQEKYGDALSCAGNMMKKNPPRRIGPHCRRRPVDRPAAAPPLMRAGEQTAFP
ncbi:hypothetical protein L085_11155 [Serratia sp. FS14]|uniref:CsbD family protein n=1 Tax=Serratia sp. (strain FS14) TaxID=1327989 RepID=UPI0004994A20|nr:CsbD family protein [Serratia sp. FS14]AIA47670.1 hypothetical protein L085_11155 [Serratia sp. FS14]